MATTQTQTADAQTSADAQTVADHINGKEGLSAEVRDIEGVSRVRVEADSAALCLRATRRDFNWQVGSVQPTSVYLEPMH